LVCFTRISALLSQPASSSAAALAQVIKAVRMGSSQVRR
jgi:hypothetical protein